MKKNSIYSLPKEMYSKISNGYPTKRGKLQKSILKLHKKAYTNAYDKLVFNKS